jgi:hypothetical protein
MSNRIVGVSCALLILTAVLGCEPKEDPLTREEANEAVAEAQLSSEAQGLTDGMVEITTDFTIGHAVEDTAEELREFVASQIPCAEAERAGGTVTINWGVAGDGCTYNGQTYTGTTAVSIARTEAGSLEVSHVWTDLSNGKVTVNGNATITWNGMDRTRRVEHESTWTDGTRTVTGTGDRTQTFLETDADSGWKLQVDGSRAWKNGDRAWDLDINQVTIRSVDPVPESGSYKLVNPAGKSLTLSFSRVDEITIQVTVSGPRKDFMFNVKKR